MSCPSLNELPLPPPGKMGWPWTIENSNLTAKEISESPRLKVSIVTPSYNQGEFIEETIRSVLLQNYNNLEYWIIDGGSTDQSIEIIRKYEPWLAGWISERDNGQSDAINKGLRLTKGEIVAWINSDDKYFPGSIEKVCSVFQNHPSVDLIYGQIEVIDKHGYLINKHPYQQFNYYNLLTQNLVIPQPATFWRKKLLDVVGYLRTDLHYAMDFEYWLRIGRNFNILGIPFLLAQYRTSEMNKGVTQSAKWGMELIKILDDFYRENNVPEEILCYKDRAYAGAFFVGGKCYLTGYELINARNWLIRAVKLDARYLLKREWWISFSKTFLTESVYRWGRELKTRIRNDGRRV
jgi:glycosyltransferase involved in cell wall biosynthesis